MPGIDFSNDPLMQGRLFSYTDTQLLRLGGPNFHEIPINRPVAPLHNNQRDGHMRQEINRGRVSYNPNSLGGGCPMQVPQAAGGYVTFPAATEGAKMRARGESFFDHYSQARMFFMSQAEHEKQHHQGATVRAGQSRGGGDPQARDRSPRADRRDAGADGGQGAGFAVPKKATSPPNMSVPADGNAKAHQHRDIADREAVSAPLSMMDSVPGPIATRKVAIMVTKEFDGAGVAAVVRALEAEGAQGMLVAPELGDITADNGDVYVPEFSILTASSVLFDAVYVADGKKAVEWLVEADAVEFVKDAYKHCKAVAATGRGVELLEEAEVGTGMLDDPEPADEATIVAAKVTRGFTQKLVAAMANHRLWSREPELHLPL